MHKILWWVSLVVILVLLPAVVCQPWESRDPRDAARLETFHVWHESGQKVIRKTRNSEAERLSRVMENLGAVSTLNGAEFRDVRTSGPPVILINMIQRGDDILVPELADEMFDTLVGSGITIRNRIMMMNSSYATRRPTLFRGVIYLAALRACFPKWKKVPEEEHLKDVEELGHSLFIHTLVAQAAGEEYSELVDEFTLLMLAKRISRELLSSHYEPAIARLLETENDSESGTALVMLAVAARFRSADLLFPGDHSKAMEAKLKVIKEMGDMFKPKGRDMLLNL